MDEPFSGDWRWFGFEGEPEPGIDYSWMQVQQGLDFVGRDETICDCSLFYSSRKTNTFLVRTPAGSDTIWNTVDCAFALVADNPSVLSVAYGKRLIHVAGVTASLVELLMRSMKLPLDSLKLLAGAVQEMTVLRSQRADPLPDGASTVADASSVTVSGESIEDVAGALTIGDTFFEIGKLRIEFADITATETNKSEKLVISLETSSNGRLDLTFDNPDASAATKISEILKIVNPM